LAPEAIRAERSAFNVLAANEHSGRLTALAIDSEGAAAAPLVSAEMPGVSYVEVEAA